MEWKLSESTRARETLLADGLPRETDEESLAVALAAYGAVASCRIVRRDTGVSTGTAEIVFADDAAVDLALAASASGKLVLSSLPVDSVSPAAFSLRRLVDPSKLLIAPGLSAAVASTK
ncbi:uncharacterized protein AMSG_07794 [Thecamonas trahens ATCC 50062]|uniref:RRM domain-containing protein n=1 Tax=Thecamonas trahens ATCC 50062 TaxID=461836 RepID=A0A0L0DHM7_THETB|nr:hypothetical protein AMSG_07794 [Thecamonas trahens ATCC 50062]KNC51725.1 hypothetical protein AMSG_07794 [Thecamonas trahens ATCC 50062]|eukprot:XP_013755854.1 hypothetical protein AMSG_07794 [Thecamonas trahens ATCC 50062]